MRPIQANSDFFQNRSTANAVVTLTIQNPNGAPMPILNTAGGVITTLAPGDTITAVFTVAAGGVLHSQLPGALMFHGIQF
jgi:hypothetical protein